MKSRSRHNCKEKGFMIFFIATLQPFIKYHSPPCFPSRNITKNAETHPPPMRDLIVEQLRIEESYRYSFHEKSRSSSPEVFYTKKVFLEISQNSQKNTCARVSFLIKLQACGCFWKSPIRGFLSFFRRKIMFNLLLFD